MSAHPQFDNASPALPADFPIVLRFESLHPNDLGRFKMHDQRQGGDLSHVDPWKRCQIGPLREGILTVNKAWFGGTGHDAWDQDRVSSFKARAMDFLNEHFPDGQLRFASAHADEEAFHIHFVIAVWPERVTANRGSQLLLQAAKNPLIGNYEYAQTLAGEAFAPLGLTRGEERAKAIREAKARGEEPPERRRHVTPSEWRAQQKAEGVKEAEAIKQAADQEAKTMIAEGRTLGTATVSKSRKRAIKEAQATKAAAAKELLAAERQKEAEEKAAMAARQAADAARQEQAEIEATVTQLAQQAGEVTRAAEAALERARLAKQAVVADVSTLQAHKVGLVAEVRDITTEKEQVQEAVMAAHQDLTDARVEMAAVSAEKVEVEDAVKAAKNDLSTVQAEVAAVSQQKEAVARDLTRLEALIGVAKRELFEVKGRVEATFKGLKLLAGQVIGWGKTSLDAEPNLIWGANAPPDPAARKELIRSIKPSFENLMPLAAAIAEAMEATTHQARKKLAEEAAFLSDLRADWPEAQKARLEDLRRQGDSPDPAFG